MDCREFFVPLPTNIFYDMGTQIKTAKEVLAQIERRYFKGAGLVKGCKLKGDERRAYVLSQVERLLATEYGASSMAMWLSDQFWIAGEGRQPMPWEDISPQVESGYRTNPLLSLQEQQTLTENEMARLRLILEVAGLCHDLALHYLFDLKEAFGIKNNWWVSNKQLVEWLTTTEYEHVAMHTAYIMKKHAISVYELGHYLPAQDELAELYSEKHRQRLGYPNTTEIPPRDYASTIIDSLVQIERHWQRGRRLKLRPDLVILHDEIYGVVPHQFDKGVLAAAQELFDYMDRELYGRFVTKDFKPWDEQPESYRQFVSEALGRFADKVR